MSLTITVGINDIKVRCPFAVKDWDASGGHTHTPSQPDDWPCYGDGKLTAGEVLDWLVSRAIEREITP